MKQILLVALLFSVLGCKDEINIPKPPTYLRLELPEHSYKNYSDDCLYSFDVAKSYLVKKVSDEDGVTCHKDIDLGKLNGSIHMSFINMTEPLSTYVNYVNDKIDEHKVKATGIEDKQYLFNNKRVYCTFFELKGDVASPFQFYITDSTSKFVSGVVYFNSTPNYDSIRPSLDYLKIDLERMIKSFEWKK